MFLRWLKKQELLDCLKCMKKWKKASRIVTVVQTLISTLRTNRNQRLSHRRKLKVKTLMIKVLELLARVK